MFYWDHLTEDLRILLNIFLDETKFQTNSNNNYTLIWQIFKYYDSLQNISEINGNLTLYFCDVFFKSIDRFLNLNEINYLNVLLGLRIRFLYLFKMSLFLSIFRKFQTTNSHVFVETEMFQGAHPFSFKIFLFSILCHEFMHKNQVPIDILLCIQSCSYRSHGVVQ